MTKKLTVSQQRLRRRLEDLLNDPEFQSDITAWREKKDNPYSLTSHLSRIFKKYKLGDNVAIFLLNYMYSNKVDYTLVSPPAYFVDEKGVIEFEDGHVHQSTFMVMEEAEDYRDYIRKNYIQLYISPDATINELKDFLAQNKERIKSDQKRIRGAEQKRVRARTQSKRDNYIKQLTAKGEGPAEIAKILNWDSRFDGGYHSSDILKIQKKMNLRKSQEQTL